MAGNSYDKYRTGNPIHRSLVRRFLHDVRGLVETIGPASVVEVGCGPGDLAALLFPGGAVVDYVGVDVSAEQVEQANRVHPELTFRVASAYGLPFEDDSVDLVLACEVLEHLEDPAVAMAEIARVGRAAIVSVPWEPVWRLANLVRGSYVASLGNTPGHLQHFSRRRIRRLVGEHLVLRAERRPFPWTVLLAASP